MCSPRLSFMIDKAKKIFYKDGIQSHSGIAKHFGVKEEDMVRIDYDWVTKTTDIYAFNKEQNKSADFKLTNEHYDRIQSFINQKAGTKEKLMKWFSKNTNDKKIREEATNILSDKGMREYADKTKKFDITKLKDTFYRYPNASWG